MPLPTRQPSNRESSEGESAFILNAILDTMPQLYEASGGPVQRSFRLAEAEASRCSLRELGSPLLEYVAACLEWFSNPQLRFTPKLPDVMLYEHIQQICVTLWLESQTGITSWNKILDYFLTAQKRTIENRAIAKSFIIDPASHLPAGAGENINLLDAGKHKLIDWLATSPFTFFRVTPLLEFLSYEATTHFRSPDFSPDYIPDFLWPMASQVADSPDRAILVDCNQRGDLLISDRHHIIAARIKGRWTVYDLDTLSTGIHKLLAQGQWIQDSEALKALSHTLFRVLFDVSFKRHGGLIIIDDSLERVKRYTHSGIFQDEPTPLSRIIPVESFGERPPDQAAIRKLIEMTSIDGAVALSSAGRMLGYGAMILPHPDVLEGSGARTFAAKSAARRGAVAFHISSDGQILSYFQTRQYTGEKVHQMRL